MSKLSNLNVKEIDKNNLGINDNLYGQVSEDVTEAEFKNIKTFVLFGLDTQSSGDGQEEEGFIGRSDSIIIVSINPKYKSIKLVSIPRDTYAEIEGHGKMKINYGYALGGPELALKTINTNFDLNLTEYATIDFLGLIHIINDIGGIELTITQEEKDYINRYSKGFYNTSGNQQKKLSYYGNVLLSGEQAVTHSSNRKVGDDFSRAKRQREVLEAIFSKVAKMDAGKISNLIDTFFREITTNINISDYLGIIGEIVLNKDIYLKNVISAQVPNKEYAEGQYIQGIYCIFSF